VAGDAVERDGGYDVPPFGCVRGELGCTEAPVDAPVGGEEEERVRQRQAGGGPRRRVGAGELDEGRGSGGVVVRPWADAAVVPVCEDDDRLVGEAAFLEEEVHEPDVAAAGDVGGEGLALHLVPVGRQLLCEPAGRRRRSGGAGHAGGEAERELGGDSAGVAAAEGGREVGRLQRRRAGDAEGEHEQRQSHQEPRAAVQRPVDGPVE
jgi:hypothetical protein